MKKLVLCATALGGLLLAATAQAASLPNGSLNAAGAKGVTQVTFWKRSCHHGDGAVSGFFGDSYSYGFVDGPSYGSSYDSEYYGGFFGDAPPYYTYRDRYRANRLWGDRRYYRRRAPGVGVYIGN